MSGPIDTAGPLGDLRALLREKVDWVPKKLYMELYGETADVINKRCRKGGGWTRGVHFNKPDGGGLWISIRAVNAWASSSTSSSS